MSHELDPREGLMLFTDGSAWTVDQSGAWAYIAVDSCDNELWAAGYENPATNNRMEMMGWIMGLQALRDRYGPCEVLVFSDSLYVGLGAMDRERNRLTNLDLWERLDQAIDRHEYVEFVHVPGHKGNVLNERVDFMASLTRKAKRNMCEEANCMLRKRL